MPFDQWVRDGQDLDPELVVSLASSDEFDPYAKRSRASGPGLRGDRISNTATHDIDPLAGQNTLPAISGGGVNANWFTPLHPPKVGYGSISMHSPVVEPWSYVTNFNDLDLTEDASASWASEFLCLFPDGPNMPMSTPSANQNGGVTSISAAVPVQDNETNSGEEVPPATEHLKHPRASSLPDSPPVPLPENGQVSATSASPLQHSLFWSNEDAERCSESGIPSTHLSRHFLKFVQPPAAILIGGAKRWRRLQEYLCKVSEQNRAVQNALFCVVGLLSIDETVKERGSAREERMRRIRDRHQQACDNVMTMLAGPLEPESKTTEHLLAAIFLLAWFEVIRDMEDSNCLFPRDLAHSVISSRMMWSRVSQELLAWMNTLDNKAAHLGGDHLLSQQTIDVISHHQTQITSSDALDDGVSPFREPSAGSDGTPTDSSIGSLFDIECSRTQRLEMNSVITQKSQIKQAILNTILQPALQWYLTSQSYCRRISAYDMYHRRRANTDDEYEIITACKQLESELCELWNFRPSVISLTAEQLMQVVPADLATRLEEIFSVYLGSFWTLFVYLHRVSWWNLPHGLPHSDLVSRALAEMWRTLQRAYGEVIEGTTKKIVHPSLLWPLFLFGCECLDLDQRKWAVQQLEGLGEAKPVLEARELEDDVDTLLPFRMSSGATKNAKRAAMLLTKLTEEQDRKKCKVDARELSIRLFGCHFSLV
ncbi:hypothetical protein RBB50_001494 [Rhinocladiella similis]